MTVRHTLQFRQGQVLGVSMGKTGDPRPVIGKNPPISSDYAAR
ncbi:MAG: hypothetical protein AAF754_10760 [Pseudomonadota bacterium]